MTHTVVSTRAVTSFFINMKQYFFILMAVIFYLVYETKEHSIVYLCKCLFDDNTSSSVQLIDSNQIWHENFSEILDDENSARSKVYLGKFSDFPNVPSGNRQSKQGGITRIADHIKELRALDIFHKFVEALNGMGLWFINTSQSHSELNRIPGGFLNKTPELRQIDFSLSQNDLLLDIIFSKFIESEIIELRNSVGKIIDLFHFFSFFIYFFSS